MKVANPDYITTKTEELLEPVNEMANNRNDFIEKIRDSRVQIIKNFAKIILLKEIANRSLNFHWAKELSENIMTIWDTKLNGDNKTKEKLKKLLDNSVESIIFSEKEVVKFPNYFKNAIESELTNKKYIGTALYDYCSKIANDKKHDFKKDIENNLVKMKIALHEAIGHLRPIATDEEREYLKYELSIVICENLNAKYE